MIELYFSFQRQCINSDTFLLQPQHTQCFVRRCWRGGPPATPAPVQFQLPYGAVGHERQGSLLCGITARL